MARALLVLLVGAFLLAPGARAQRVERVAELGALAFDVEADPSRSRYYVSLPMSHEVAVVDGDSLEIVDRLAVGPLPQGLDLSHDAARLFVALGGSGAVGVVDLATNQISRIDVRVALGETNAYDVIEAQPNRLFVSAHAVVAGVPGRIVQVRLDQGNAVSRVANNRLIRVRPVFEVSPDGGSLYVAAGSSVSTLFKLDLGQDGAPIALEANVGPIQLDDLAADRARRAQISVSRDGSRILVSSGLTRGGREPVRVLDTATFAEIRRHSLGVAQHTPDGLQFAIAREPNLLERYGPGGAAIAGGELGCSFSSILRLLAPDTSAAVLLGDDLLCVSVLDATCTGLPPVPEQPEPIPGAIEDALRPELRWSDAGAGCQSKFEVRIGDANPPSDLVCAGIGEAQCRPRMLEPGTQYFWQVTARNSAGRTLGPVWSFRTAPSAPVSFAPISTKLADRGSDLVFDPLRRRYYVSLPELNQVQVVSSESYAVLDLVWFRAPPRGLELSSDGSRLFAALDGAGAVAAIDLETLAVREIDLSRLFSEGRIWDVLEAEPDRLFVCRTWERCPEWPGAGPTRCTFRRGARRPSAPICPGANARTESRSPLPLRRGRASLRLPGALQDRPRAAGSARRARARQAPRRLETRLEPRRQPTLPRKRLGAAGRILRRGRARRKRSPGLRRRPRGRALRELSRAGRVLRRAYAARS